MGQKAFFQLNLLGLVIEEHLFRQLAWIGQTKNVRMRFQPKYLLIVLMILKCRLSDPYVLALAQPLEFLVQNLSMPDLICIVNDPNL